MTESITITINDNEIEANSNETIWEVASRNGIEIPHYVINRLTVTGRMGIERAWWK